MNRKGKPVRKCHGCILNIGERCAIFDEPHDKWHNSKCSSYNDKELYRKYLKDLEKHLERTRGMGLGILLATMGISAGGASLFTRWLSGS